MWYRTADDQCPIFFSSVSSLCFLESWLSCLPRANTMRRPISPSDSIIYSNINSRIYVSQLLLSRLNVTLSKCSQACLILFFSSYFLSFKHHAWFRKYIITFDLVNKMRLFKERKQNIPVLFYNWSKFPLGQHTHSVYTGFFHQRSP